MFCKMTVARWIEEREISGYTTFSFEDVAAAFPRLSDSGLRVALWRQISSHRITIVHRGFYVIVPPINRKDGIVSPYYYLNNMMLRIGRDYYVSLLTAASLYGATHQAVMTCDVMIPIPHISFSRKLNSQISWHYRVSIPSEFVEKRKTEIGYMNVSSPELTALDLVKHSEECGGISHVATVLAELTDSLDFHKSNGRVLTTASSATIQRLGYIIETVLGQTKLTDDLYNYWRAQVLHPRFVGLGGGDVEPPFGAVRCECDSRWKVLINVELDIDDL